MCPAWMIYGMCESGREAAWCKDDVREVGKKREYDKQWTNWWFNDEFKGGLLGFKFGIGRGKEGQAVQGEALSDIIEKTTDYSDIHHPEYHYVSDLEVYIKLNKSRKEAVENLKTALATSQASMKLGLKQ